MQTNLKPLPIGIQTIKDIIQQNFLYIDKTEYIYNIIKDNKGAYFLSRPRRFGKSLLISTLEQIFLGNKELFKGLDIYKKTYNWQQYPVIRIDFSEIKLSEKDSIIELKESIKKLLDYNAQKYNINLTDNIYSLRFKELIF